MFSAKIWYDSESNYDLTGQKKIKTFILVSFMASSDFFVPIFGQIILLLVQIGQKFIQTRI